MYMFFKIWSINELLRLSGNRHLIGWRGKKSAILEKNVYFKETTSVEWIEANCILKIIIFRYFAFFLELAIYFLLFNHYYLFIIFIYFCGQLFQVRMCVPCVQVATALLILEGLRLHSVPQFEKCSLWGESDGGPLQYRTWVPTIF